MLECICCNGASCLKRQASAQNNTLSARSPLLDRSRQAPPHKHTTSLQARFRRCLGAELLRGGLVSCRLANALANPSRKPTECVSMLTHDIDTLTNALQQDRHFCCPTLLDTSGGVAVLPGSFLGIGEESVDRASQHKKILKPT